MSLNRCNDVILEAYLTSEDAGETERELEMLIAEHAEPRLRGVILGRLGFQISRHGRHAEFEDLCSEVRTRLVAYLQNLKKNLKQSPCEDFRRYVAAVSHNTCHDFYRQRFPARSRLQRRVRDLLHARRGLAMWKSGGEQSSEWLCGFDFWKGTDASARGSRNLSHFLEDPESAMRTLTGSHDPHSVDFCDLVVSIFVRAEGPVRFSALVDLIAEIKGVKDAPMTSVDNEESGPGEGLEDSRLRIDSQLEMRQYLAKAWRVLSEMPREDARAYLLYARDTSGENLLSMFMSVGAATEIEIADVLGVSLDGLSRLLQDALPMENDEIAMRLGVTLERLYKLRYRAGKRVRAALAEMLGTK